MRLNTFLKYIFLFCGIYFLVTICESVEGFDLHRSYEEANIYAEQFTVSELILYRLLKTIDFIYYLIHYYANKVSISPNIVTTSIVFVYYSLVIYAINNIFEVKVNSKILLVTLFTVPAIYVISVARNLTAFMFLYCAIVAFYKNKKGISLIFIVISVFTHFTTLMYVAVLFLALLLQNKKLSSNSLLLIIVSTFCVSIFAPTLINNVMFRIIGGYDMHYMIYSNDVAINYLFHSSINYADKLPVTISYIYSITLLFVNKERGFEFWSLLLLTIMLSFFMNSSFSLVTRCIMFLPMFWGLNIGRIMKSPSVQGKYYLENFSWLGLLCLLLHIYGYRQIYLSFV